MSLQEVLASHSHGSGPPRATGAVSWKRVSFEVEVELVSHALPLQAVQGCRHGPPLGGQGLAE